MKQALSNKNKIKIINAVCTTVSAGAVCGVLYASGIFAPNGSATAANHLFAVQAADAVAAPGMAPGAGAPKPPMAANVPGAPPATTPGMPGKAAGKKIGKKPGKGKTAGVATTPGTAAAPGTVTPGGVAVAPPPYAAHNPFQPRFTVATLIPPPTPVWQLVPFVIYAEQKPQGPTGPNVVPQAPLPTGRVSGIIFSNGIRALYESGGSTHMIQPGDSMPDGSGSVLSIQADGITVRLANQQTMQLPISAGNPNMNGAMNYQPPVPGAPGFPVTGDNP